jgi:hypothetical protein
VRTTASATVSYGFTQAFVQSYSNQTLSALQYSIVELVRFSYELHRFAAALAC